MLVEPGAEVGLGQTEEERVAAPCKLLDDTMGSGAQEALRRRAGTVFRVLEGGSITIGDRVVVRTDHA